MYLLTTGYITHSEKWASGVRCSSLYSCLLLCIQLVTQTCFDHPVANVGLSTWKTGAVGTYLLNKWVNEEFSVADSRDVDMSEINGASQGCICLRDRFCYSWLLYIPAQLGENRGTWADPWSLPWKLGSLGESHQGALLLGAT